LSSAYFIAVIASIRLRWERKTHEREFGEIVMQALVLNDRFFAAVLPCTMSPR